METDTFTPRVSSQPVYQSLSRLFVAVSELCSTKNARTVSLLYTGKTTDKVTCDFPGKIQAPTLVLRGSDEGYAMTHIKAAECIPGSQLSVIKGVEHDGAGKKVAEISQRAQEFWRTVK